MKALRHDPSKSAGSKHSDGHGLYLHVKESGKYWRMAYRFAGKQKTLALGVYPTVGLARARRRRMKPENSSHPASTPALQSKSRSSPSPMPRRALLRAVVREFHGVKSGAWSDTYAEKWLRNMSKDLFPHVGRMLLPEIPLPCCWACSARSKNEGTRNCSHASPDSRAGVSLRHPDGTM
ncbi:integrase arm-type DNA-binding domain-containing protein [Delftia sp.]|uniref:integrase arm-type DNA-binding domain-containing protein n=1 Tax=Delftia sp. TaxID=1886637 RepID=UPI00259C7C68|nr:integrase arm-type DNA-binding domain-containing protein [Delftia sp.]